MMTGTILALSRAIGETAPLITLGAFTYLAFDPTPFSQFTALPIQILNWVVRPQAGLRAARGRGEHRPARPAAVDERDRDRRAEPLPEGVVARWVTSQPIGRSTAGTATVHARPNGHGPVTSPPTRTGLRGQGPLRVLRRLPRAARRHVRHPAQPDHGDHRSVRLREVDADPLLQPDERPRPERPRRRARSCTTASISTARTSTPSRSGKRIGMVFQKPNPFPKSIYENVAFGPKVNGVKSGLDDIVEKALVAGRPLGRGQGQAASRTPTRCPAASSSGCASPARSPSSRRSS